VLIYRYLASFFSSLSIFFITMLWKKLGVYDEKMRRKRTITQFIDSLDQ
jgi:hypothetical protein